MKIKGVVNLSTLFSKIHTTFNFHEQTVKIVVSDSQHWRMSKKLYVILSCGHECGKVEVDTFSRQFQPLKQERFACIHKLIELNDV